MSLLTIICETLNTPIKILRQQMCYVLIKCFVEYGHPLNIFLIGIYQFLFQEMADLFNLGTFRSCFIAGVILSIIFLVTYWGVRPTASRCCLARNLTRDVRRYLAFYPRPVLAFGYCRCLRLWVCQSVCQSLVCPHDNPGPVQARMTKFGPKV